jgi:hypothetical protein
MIDTDTSQLDTILNTIHASQPTMTTTATATSIPDMELSTSTSLGLDSLVMNQWMESARRALHASTTNSNSINTPSIDTNFSALARDKLLETLGWTTNSSSNLSTTTSNDHHYQHYNTPVYSTSTTTTATTFNDINGHQHHHHTSSSNGITNNHTTTTTNSNNNNSRGPTTTRTVEELERELALAREEELIIKDQLDQIIKKNQREMIY